MATFARSGMQGLSRPRKRYFWHSRTGFRDTRTRDRVVAVRWT